ncbi:MAG TPA: ABC transporter substrate-binding protein [Candidatus Nanoarchaeia archaeon]|nr:ABC transporter substrate-binding protein [Candidatus Nanoarchaeia archaeon]
MKNAKTISVFIFLILSACAPQETIKIGWIGPLTGSGAVLGIDSVVAAQIAIDEVNTAGGVNGRQLELLIEDDQYDVTKAVTSYNKLVQVNDVDIVLVNTFGSVFALADQAEKDNVLLFDPLDCNSVLAELSKNVFCLATDTESLAAVLVQQAEIRQIKSVGIIHWNSDQFMPLVKDFFAQKFSGTIPVTYAYPAGTDDFKTPLARMIDEKVDAIVLLGYDETGIAMKQAREIGFTGHFLATGTVTSPSLQKAAQGTAEGTIFSFWRPPTGEATEAFNQKFVQKQGRSPILDLATYPTYDAVHALAHALPRTEADLADALVTVSFAGVTGNISFTPEGAFSIPEHPFVLTNGTAKPLS